MVLFPEFCMRRLIPEFASKLSEHSELIYRWLRHDDATGKVGM